MRRLVFLFLLMLLFAVPAKALELTAPTVPEAGEFMMPENTDSFSDGLIELFRNAIGTIRPDIREAGITCMGIMGIALILSVFQALPGSKMSACELVGAVAVGILLLRETNSLVNLGRDTVMEVSGYGLLLLPVMTAALAAQGGITGSAALYTGTAFFNSLLSNLISKLLTPMIYLYLALAVANCAVEENLLKQLRDFVKWLMVWVLKIILYVFTGYMGITGVVSGTTDAATLKAAKLTISGMVPVVGSILSDASEAVLVSAGVIKNGVGIAGMLAVVAFVIVPFLKLGLQYLTLKLAGAMCKLFPDGTISALVEDFSGGMGFLLGMTGAMSLMLLISLMCFLKGMG